MKNGKTTENNSEHKWSGTEDEEEMNLLLGLLYDSDMEFDSESAEANLMIPTGDPDSPSLLKWHEDSPPPPPPTFKRASKDRKRKSTETDHGLKALKRSKYEELLALQDKPTTSRQAADLSAKIKAFKELNEIPEEEPEDVRRTASKTARVSARVRVKSAQATMEISESPATEEAIMQSLEEIEPINLLDDFEQEIDKESMEPRTLGHPGSAFTPDSDWQGSFVARLTEFEGIMDPHMTEVTDPGAKKPRTMSMGNSQRPWAPPSPRDELSVGNKLSKMYCTLQLNTTLSLEMVANALGNAVFSRHIGVVQKRYIATQIAWIWAEGTVMIVNGSSRSMLAETQVALMAKIGGQANFKADASNDLQLRRTTAHVEFPWQIDMPEFCAAHSLSSRLLLNEMHYVYYVDKDLPGVAARVHGTGWIQVFSMSSEKTDQMLTKLYYLTGNYKKD